MKIRTFVKTFPNTGSDSYRIVTLESGSEILELNAINRPLGYERVHLPLCKVAYPPFHFQGYDIICMW